MKWFIPKSLFFCRVSSFVYFFPCLSTLIEETGCSYYRIFPHSRFCWAASLQNHFMHSFLCSISCKSVVVVRGLIRSGSIFFLFVLQDYLKGRIGFLLWEALNVWFSLWMLTVTENHSSDPQACILMPVLSLWVLTRPSHSNGHLLHRWMSKM